MIGPVGPEPSRRPPTGGAGGAGGTPPAPFVRPEGAPDAGRAVASPAAGVPLPDRELLALLLRAVRTHPSEVGPLVRTLVLTLGADGAAAARSREALLARLVAVAEALATDDASSTPADPTGPSRDAARVQLGAHGDRLELSTAPRAAQDVAAEARVLGLMLREVLAQHPAPVPPALASLMGALLAQPLAPALTEPGGAARALREAAARAEDEASTPLDRMMRWLRRHRVSLLVLALVVWLVITLLGLR